MSATTDLAEAVIHVSIDHSQMDGGLSQAKDKAERGGQEIGSAFSEEFERSVMNVVSGAAIIALLDSVIEKVKETFDESIQKGYEADQVLSRLGATAGESAEEVTAFAEAQRKSLGIQALATERVAGYIAAITHLSGDTLVEATKAVQQWQAMSGKSEEAALRDVIRFVESGINIGFKRFGLAIESSGDKLTNLQTIISATGPGLEILRAHAETGEGAAKKLASAWDNFLEKMGGAVVDSPGWKHALNELEAAVEELIPYLPVLGHALADLASDAAQLVKWFVDAGLKVEQFKGYLIDLATFHPLGTFNRGVELANTYLAMLEERSHGASSALADLGDEATKAGDKASDAAKKQQELAQQLYSWYNGLSADMRRIADSYYPGLRLQAKAAETEFERMKQTVEDAYKALEKRREEERKAAEDAKRTREKEIKDLLEIGKLLQAHTEITSEILAMYPDLELQYEKAVKAHWDELTPLEKIVATIQQAAAIQARWDEAAMSWVTRAEQGDQAARRYLQTHKEILEVLLQEVKDQYANLWPIEQQGLKGQKLVEQARELTELLQGHYREVEATGQAWVDAAQNVATYEQAIQNVQAAMQGRSLQVGGTGNAALDFLLNQFVDKNRLAPPTSFTLRSGYGGGGGNLPSFLSDIQQPIQADYQQLQKNAQILAALGVDYKTPNFTSLDQVHQQLLITNKLLAEFATRGSRSNPQHVVNHPGPGTGTGDLAMAGIA